MDEANLFAKARGLSREDLRLMAVAVTELAIARLRHATTPAATIIAELRIPPPPRRRRREAPDLTRIAWAIAAAARRAPWRADCLLQAMAARRWLDRYGLPSEFFVGVAKDANACLISHAWLKS